MSRWESIFLYQDTPCSNHEDRKIRFGPLVGSKAARSQNRKLQLKHMAPSLSLSESLSLSRFLSWTDAAASGCCRAAMPRHAALDC